MLNPRLENWAIAYYDPTGYTPPERCETVLHGHVSGHPSFPNDHPVTTSRLIGISISKKLARTRSRIYELGTPDKKFLDYLVSIGKKLEDYEKVLPLKEE